METPSLLLIGGDGLLGSVLARELPRQGILCAATSRREGALPLNLENPLPQQLHAVLRCGQFTHAVLSAAMAEPDACFRDPQRALRVNLEAPRELFALLREEGIRVLYFSTDLVFGGALDLPQEEAALRPTTLYACLKMEAEIAARELCAEALIFRLGKLMAMDLHPRSILTPIVKAGRGQADYRAFRDQLITPVFVEDIARAVAKAVRLGLSGTYHLAGKECLSRWELALQVCRELGLDPGRVQTSSMADAGFAEPRGRSNTLNAEKFRRDAGFAFTTLKEGLGHLRGHL